MVVTVPAAVDGHADADADTNTRTDHVGIGIRRNDRASRD
jgi:hypothetical protein